MQLSASFGPMIGLFLFWGLVPSLQAQTLLLDDFEGNVEVQSANGWKPLDTGAAVPLSAVVRVSGHGYAEFVEGSTRIHLAKDGSYRLASLAAPGKNAPRDLLNRTSHLVGAVLGSEGTGGGVPTANMGIRGAEKKGNTDNLDWEDDSSTETDPTAASDALVAQGNYTDALGQLNLALARSSDQSPILYLKKATVLALMGRAAAALRAAESVSLPPGSPELAGLNLLMASQGLAVGDFALAIQKSQAGLKLAQAPEMVQNLELVEALGYRGQAKEPESRALLQKLVTEAGASPAGQDAARILGP